MQPVTDRPSPAGAHRYTLRTGHPRGGRCGPLSRRRGVAGRVTRIGGSAREPARTEFDQFIRACVRAGLAWGPGPARFSRGRAPGEVPPVRRGGSFPAAAASRWPGGGGAAAVTQLTAPPRRREFWLPLSLDPLPRAAYRVAQTNPPA